MHRRCLSERTACSSGVSPHRNRRGSWVVSSVMVRGNGQETTTVSEFNVCFALTERPVESAKKI